MELSIGYSVVGYVSMRVCVKLEMSVIHVGLSGTGCELMKSSFICFIAKEKVEKLSVLPSKEDMKEHVNKET